MTTGKMVVGVLIHYSLPVSLSRSCNAHKSTPQKSHTEQHFSRSTRSMLRVIRSGGQHKKAV